MPHRRKLFLRRIVKIETSADVTSRGRPSHYIYTLECGHTTLEPHSPRSCVQLFAHQLVVTEYGIVKAGQDFPHEKHCWRCERGEPESPKCERTSLPVGIMPYLGYCKKNCTDDKITNCTKQHSEWNKTRKT